MRIPLLLASALLLAAPPLAAQADTATPDTVRLRFGWSPGDSARVWWERVRIRGTAARADTSRLAYSYTLSVQEHTEGLQLVSSDADWGTLGGEGDPMTRAMLEAMAGMGITGTPGTVVAPSGAFVRVEGVAELRDLLVGAMRSALEGTDGGGTVADAIGAAFTEEALTASAAGDWNGAVGFWIDADLELEGWYELEDEMESPFAPGTRIPTTILFGAEALVPCRESRADDRTCVLLVAETVPDPDALAQVTRELMSRMGMPPEEMEGLPMEFSTTVVSTLVTEKATLRPWSLTVEKSVVVEVDGETTEQVDVQTTRYEWLP
jgi:hypothetical protein